MKGEPVKYNYNTNIKWTSEKKGVLSSNGKPDIIVACPPEFGGHEGIWSPEDLYLASVEICTMTTFLWFVKKYKLDLKYYKSKASGVAELINSSFQFSKININLEIGIANKNDIKKVERIIEKTPEICLISKSIKTEVFIKSEIKIV